MSITEFLTWMASGLGSSVILSYLVERWAWFQTLTSVARKVLSVVGTVVISVAAYLLLTYVPADVWVMLSPYWQIVIGAVGTYFGVQIFHSFDRTSTKVDQEL